MACHPVRLAHLDREGPQVVLADGPHDKTMVASVFSFLREWREHGGPSDLKTIAFLTCDNLFCQDNRKVASELAPQSGFKDRPRPDHEDGGDHAGLRGPAPAGRERGRSSSSCSTRRRRRCSRVTRSARASCPRWWPRATARTRTRRGSKAQKKTNGGVGWLGRGSHGHRPRP
jgi:hypothetical protein